MITLALTAHPATRDQILTERATAIGKIRRTEETKRYLQLFCLILGLVGAVAAIICWRIGTASTELLSLLLAFSITGAVALQLFTPGKMLAVIFVLSAVLGSGMATREGGQIIGVALVLVLWVETAIAVLFKTKVNEPLNDARSTLEALRTLPVEDYPELMQLCKNHAGISEYRDKVNAEKRSLVVGELVAMRSFAKSVESRANTSD